MTPIKPRLHVLLASRARIGLVIRRGPSRRVCTMLWDRDRDEFRLGQWLKGRIYERRSDLSPDGEHFLYFAMNGRAASETGGSWTAISRAPYLKAIALFAKGDCWNGGGLFTGSDQYWLNDGPGHTTLRDSGELRRDRKYRPPSLGNNECLGVYYPRLLRDGWGLVSESRITDDQKIDIFEKPAWDGWILRKLAHSGSPKANGKGCYWDEHELAHPALPRPIARPDWEWAEVDGERIVWAEGGKLLAATLGNEGPNEATVLFDFDGMSFQSIEAPY
ncbi:hypothetical protein P12x_004823 [Tundrisphaera lichenicola]|uniref:hypothetical protein n=1 Tax=Tundrisphaera lichenicola TaxID=2029860 RepID=UPI003EC02357